MTAAVEQCTAGDGCPVHPDTHQVHSPYPPAAELFAEVVRLRAELAELRRAHELAATDLDTLAAIDRPGVAATLSERFRAAGLPVPGPMTPEERVYWDRRLAEAEAGAARFWAEHVPPSDPR